MLSNPVQVKAAPVNKDAAPVSNIFPVCPRPRDFSVSKDVSVYETCVGRQEKFCQQNEKNPNCKKVLRPKNSDLIKTGPGSNTAAACAIQNDGSYKCEQEMVRFLVPEELIQPLASPTGLPTLNEDGTVAPAPTVNPGATPATGGASSTGAAPATAAPPPYIPPPPSSFMPK